MTKIEPRTLKGFQDVMPAKALQRAGLIRKLEDVFRAHGYGPIDTPSLEYAEILKGKGGDETDKQLFEFDDAGGRRVALRFDLTVPLARFVAEHQSELVFPFRRYAIGHVWRGERPQKGRFREFVQCDADLVGATGPAADAEILVLMSAAYAALDVGAVTLRINERRILNGLLERAGGTASPTAVLRALDKRDKQGDDAVAAELASVGLSPDGARMLLDATRPRGTDAETLAVLGVAVAGSALGEAGLAHLMTVRELVLAAGVPAQAVQIDPTIARGLDYYTGIVLEARLDAVPSVGSVGSGGRYDDLAGLYTNTRLPGVGCSIGIDRLLVALDELVSATTEPQAKRRPAVLITNPGADGPRMHAAFGLAATLRSTLGELLPELSVEVYPEDRKHAAQMKYADRRGIRHVLTLNDDGSWHGKDLLGGATALLPDRHAILEWLLGRKLPAPQQG